MTTMYVSQCGTSIFKLVYLLLSLSSLVRCGYGSSVVHEDVWQFRDEITQSVLSSSAKSSFPFPPSTVKNATGLVKRRMSMSRRREETDSEEERDKFQELLSSFRISLDDVLIDQGVVKVLVKDLVCYGLNFDTIAGDTYVAFADPSLDPPIETDRVLTDFEVGGLGVSCDFNLKWRIGVFPGESKATIHSYDNDLLATLLIMGSDFTEFAPSRASITKCQSSIGIDDLDFSGSVSAQVLNILEDLVLAIIGSQIDSLLCDGLRNANLMELIVQIEEALDTFNEPLEAWRLDPLYAETKFTSTSNIDGLIRFNESGGVGGTIVQALRDANEATSEIEADLTAPNENKTDLKINTIIRENVLDENRMLILNLTDSDVSFPIPENDYVALSIKLQTVQVDGLDTFLEFEPFWAVGNFTIQNRFQLERLSVKIDLQANITGSTSPTSAVMNVESLSPVVEDIYIEIGFQDLYASLAFFLAVDPLDFLNLSVGNVLSSDSIVPCILSEVRDIGLSDLNISVGGVDPPVITGLVYDDIDSIVKSFFDASFATYEERTADVMPYLSQTVIRDAINDTLTSDTLGECIVPGVKGTIDFRDFFLEASEATKLGGTGNSPYGSIFPSLVSLLNSVLVTVDEESGSLQINTIAVGPGTKLLSDKEGTVRVDFPIESFSTEDNSVLGTELMIERFDFEIRNILLENLDSVAEPLQLFQATENPHVFNNTFSLDPLENERLNASITLAMSLVAENIPSIVNNEIEITASASSITLLTQVFAKVSAYDLFNFPLEDYGLVFCWLALLTEDVTAMGRTLGFERFMMDISGFDLDIKCVNCDSGLSALPEIVGIYNRSGVTQALAQALPILLNEVVSSPTLSRIVTDLIKYAPYQCEHRPEYNPNFVQPDFVIPPLPSVLSREANEALLLSTFSLSMVGIIVVTETHLLWEAPEKTFNGPTFFGIQEDANLLDFRNLDEAFFDGADEIVTSVREMLSGSETSTDEDIPINSLLEGLMEDDGYFVLEFETPIEIPLQVLTLNLKKVRVKGLDSFTTLDLLTPVDAQTLALNFHLQQFELILDFNLPTTTDSQDFEVVFSMGDVRFETLLYAAIDLDIWHGLEVGKFLLLDNILPCFNSAFYGVYLSRLNVTVGTFEPPQLNGMNEPMGSALRNATFELNSIFGESVLQGLPVVFDNTIRFAINDVIASLLGDNECFAGPLALVGMDGSYLSPGPALIDFRDLLLESTEAKKLGGYGNEPYGDVVWSIVDAVKSQLYNANESTGEMTFVNGITSGVFDEGTFTSDGVLIQTADDLFWIFRELIFNITFVIKDLEIANLDTLVEPLAVMDNIKGDAHRLKSSIKSGSPQRPLRLSFTVYHKIISEEGIPVTGGFENEFRLTFEMDNAHASIDAMAKILEARMLGYPMRDIFNINCLSTMIASQLTGKSGGDKYGPPNAVLGNATLNFEKVRFMIECLNCSSQTLIDAQETLSTDTSIEEMTDLTRKLVNYLGPFVEPFLQPYINKFLANGEKNCPSHPNYVVSNYTGILPDLSDIPFPMNQDDLYSNIGYSEQSQYIAFLVLLFAIATVAFSSIRKRMVHRRYRRYLCTLEEKQLKEIRDQQERDREFDAGMNEISSSMIRSDEVSWLAKILVPIVLGVTVLLFRSAHLTVAADLGIYVDIYGEQISIKRWIVFKVLRTIYNLWRLEIYPMAIFLASFSVAWPYVKQGVTVFCWFLPTNVLPLKLRRSILYWLDTLARWSMVDIFQIIIFVLMFRVSASLPQNKYLPNDFFSLDFVLTARWGIYANMIAQIMSQLTSHYIIYVNNNIFANAEKKQAKRLHKTSDGMQDEPKHWTEVDSQSSTEKKRLCDTSWSRPLKHGFNKLATRPHANTLVLLSIILTIVCIISGCMLPNITVARSGFFGGIMALETLERSLTHYTFFDVVKQLGNDATAFSSSLGVAVGTYSYLTLMVLCIFLVPIGETIALAVMWFKPMTDKQRLRLTNLIQIIESWQYSDVWLLALVFTNWQIRVMTARTYRGFCAAFNLEPVLAEGLRAGVIPEQDANCFRIDPKIEIGFLILFCGSFFLSCLNSFVVGANVQYMLNKEEEKNKYISSLASQHEKSKKGIETGTIYDVDKDDYEGDIPNTKKKETILTIVPPPIVFSDYFSWLLREGGAVELTYFSDHEQAESQELSSDTPRTKEDASV